MKLVFLLGNIGDSYRGTRHNIAWDSFDDDTLTWRERPKFRAYIAEADCAGEKVLYVRPNTYYTEAGASLRQIIDFHKIANEDVLIIHDDSMLPFGTIRTRIGGRDAGNNGLKSITQHVGDDIARLRIGIATEQRAQIGDTAFVLGKFSVAERDILEQLQPQIHMIVTDFCAGKFSTTTYRHA